jgi:hypothetical protein
MAMAAAEKWRSRSWWSKKVIIEPRFSPVQWKPTDQRLPRASGVLAKGNRGNDRLGEISRPRTASLPHERRRESRPAGSQGIFRTASIRSAAPGWVAKNPPLPGPETCRSQVKVSIIISFG